ncbi:Cement protein 3B variant 1 [Rhodotorula toruloides]|nr:Cement protein 3B variant 1 [Rhodotorula toruloides]
MILAEKEFPAALAALPSVRHASFVGAAQDSHKTVVSLSLGSDSPFLNLQGLLYQNCAIRITASSTIRPLQLVKLALGGHLLYTKAFAELLHPKTSPALRYLGLAGRTSEADILVDCAPLLAQLTALQLDEVTGPPKARDGTSLRKVYTECADKFIVNAWIARKWPSNLVQYVLYDRPVWIDYYGSLDAGFASYLPSLQAVFVPYGIGQRPQNLYWRWRSKEPLEEFLQLMARRSIEVVWVNEAEYTFILPEFERYLKAKQQHA